MYSRLGACLVTPRDLSHKRLSHRKKRADLFYTSSQLGWFWVRFGPDNLKRHKVRMRVRPRHRLSLCFKKSVDHDSLELARSPSAEASGFATNDRRSGVDCSAGAIGEDNFTAVRNSLWIDGAMSGAQSSACTGVFRALTCPVTGNACQDRLPARES